MHLIKYNLQRILMYMFRQWGAILRESFGSVTFKPNTLIWVCLALIGMITILKLSNTENLVE